jgi:hypothetical protein
MKPFLPGETVIQYGERLSAEIARLRAGLSALVNCRSPLTRAQMREAAAEVLAGKTTPMQDQSPFVETNARLRAENERMRGALVKIDHEYENKDLNHVDFRVLAKIMASEVLLTNGHPSPSGPSALTLPAREPEDTGAAVHEAKGATAPSSLETPK